MYSFSINILKSLEGCILATLLKIALDEDIICVNVTDEIPRGLKVSPQIWNFEKKRNSVNIAVKLIQ